MVMPVYLLLLTVSLEQPVLREHEYLEGILTQWRVLDIDNGQVVQLIQRLIAVLHWAPSASHMVTPPLSYNNHTQ